MSGVTSTGTKELLAGIGKLSPAVTAAARRVAIASSNRIASSMRRLIRVRTGKTRSTIAIEVEEQKRQVVIKVGDIDGPPVAWFIERGTVRMEAKPFMRPSFEAENDQYRHDLERETAAAAQDALG